MLKEINISFINFYLFFFLFLFSFKNFKCQSKDFYNSYCVMNDQDMYSLLNEYCFNDILYFKNKNYHLAKNKHGDLVVQLTENTENIELTNSKIFYGLKSDGRYFFSNKLKNIGIIIKVIYDEGSQ